MTTAHEPPTDTHVGVRIEEEAGHSRLLAEERAVGRYAIINGGVMAPIKGHSGLDRLGRQLVRIGHGFHVAIFELELTDDDPGGYVSGQHPRFRRTRPVWVRLDPSRDELIRAGISAHVRSRSYTTPCKSLPATRTWVAWPLAL